MGPDKKVIYLTFDEGTMTSYLPQIVEVLNKNNVKGTFFLCKNYIKNNKELINKMLDSGHSIGNHTASHLSMPSLASKENFSKYLEEIISVEDTFKEITGREIDKIYREPRGEFSKRSLSIMKDLGYSTYFWSSAYKDWDDKLTKEDLEEIRSELKCKEAFTFDEEVRNNLLTFIKEGTEDYYKEWYSEYEMFLANSTDKEKDALSLVIEQEGISLDIASVVDESKIFEDKAMRDINYQVMNVISAFLPNFIGGSADLFCSTKTYLKGKGEFSRDSYEGRNINFGVREGATGAILNGIALSNIRTYGSTFLAFSDYMKPAIRMSAMMDLPVTYIFSHDSIRVGEDGPTHQPIEQLGSLRSIPNFSVYRPCDYKELIGSWSNILKEAKPCALVLPRGHNDTLEHTSSKKTQRGGYIISEVKTRLDLIIIATGSEVALALKIKEELLKNYIEARVVSMPNMNLFLKQDKDYQEQVLPRGYRRMVIELSNDANWYRFISSDQDFIGVNEFGRSATEEELLSYFELDMQDIIIKIKNNL